MAAATGSSRRWQHWAVVAAAKGILAALREAAAAIFAKSSQCPLWQAMAVEATTAGSDGWQLQWAAMGDGDSGQWQMVAAKGGGNGVVDRLWEWVTAGLAGCLSAHRSANRQAHRQNEKTILHMGDE